jgi:hypothetical protein
LEKLAMFFRLETFITNCFTKEPTFTKAKALLTWRTCDGQNGKFPLISFFFSAAGFFFSFQTLLLQSVV